MARVILCEIGVECAGQNSPNWARLKLPEISDLILLCQLD